MDVTCCSDSSEQNGNEITPLTCHGPPRSGSFNQGNSFLPCLLAVTGSGCKWTGVAYGRGGVSLRFCNLLSRMLQCQWNVKHLSKSLNLLLDNCYNREDGSCEQLSRGVAARKKPNRHCGLRNASIHYSFFVLPGKEPPSVPLFKNVSFEVQ